MSNEKKIKDLMARLAGMSPEPPPYPEESPVARPEAARKRRPALVFVGAAALVMLLAVPLLLLLTGGEGPIAGSTTTTSTSIVESSTTSEQMTTTTAPPPTTTATPEDTIWEGTVYLHQTPENSSTGNPALIPVSLRVADPGGRISPAAAFTTPLAALEGNLPDGTSSSIPPDVEVISTSRDGDVILAEMSESFLRGASPPGLLSDFTMLNQLVYTLTIDAPDAVVQFTVGGEPVDIFGTEGIELTTPVGRDSFLDWAHMINITRPILPNEDGDYQVEGLANVFEASLTWQVLDGSGEVVHEEFTTASCGTGCWGEFEIEVDADLIVPGESSIRLLTYSAEDGSPTNMITVPIPEEGIWQFTAGE